VSAPVELLQKVPLFAGLESRELQSIASSMKERTFPAGSTVTEEGRSGAGFFVIADGEAEVSSHGQHRRDLGVGDHFGEIALITDTDRTATIRAKTDLRCFGLTSWEFKPLVESNGTIAWKLLQSMGRMLSNG
jgi:CRP/FNR family transcriptional regulator, cyclic AMP receptor protein